jgi:hypothetical protein
MADPYHGRKTHELTTPSVYSKTSFPFSFDLPRTLPSSFDLHPPGHPKRTSTRANTTYTLVARLILATGAPTSPRLNEIFTRREVVVVSPLSEGYGNDDADEREWELRQRSGAVLKVTNRTHVVDNSGGGSVFLDVELGNAEGCWVLEGDEVEVRVRVRNGCRGLWVGPVALGSSQGVGS